MISLILGVGWTLLAITAFATITVAVLKKNADQMSMITAFKKQKWFWITASMLAICQSVAGFILQPKYQQRIVPESHFSITTLNQPPAFSCSKVEQVGNNWHIIGPVTIAGSVFQEDTFSPHAVIINGIDITNFLSDHCDPLRLNKIN